MRFGILTVTDVGFRISTVRDSTSAARTQVHWSELETFKMSKDVDSG